MLANKQRKNTQPSQQCVEAVILQAACTIYTAFPQSPTPQTFVQSNSKTVSGGIRRGEVYRPHTDRFPYAGQNKRPEETKITKKKNISKNCTVHFVTGLATEMSVTSYKNLSFQPSLSSAN